MNEEIKVLTDFCKLYEIDLKENQLAKFVEFNSVLQEILSERSFISKNDRNKIF